MTDKALLEDDSIWIRKPIPDDKLSRMNREELGEVLASAKADYEAKMSEAADVLKRFGGPTVPFCEFIMTGEWYRQVTIHAAAFDALNRVPAKSPAD